MTGDIYTHGHQDAVLRAHRWRTAENSAAYLLAHLQAGHRLLDVGCGPGTLTADLARRVSPGEAVGVDMAASVVEEAVGHAARSQIDNVSFRVGDFRDAGLEPASFDVVHAHQVLQHLSDPVGALEAMARLARPGGIVAARDADYSGFVWSPADQSLDRWRDIYLAVCRRNGAEPDAGRWLLRWARAAGLSDIAYASSTWTFASTEDRTWWAALWAERCVSSSFAQQAVDYGIASPSELEGVAHGWRRWAEDPDALFIAVHGEVLARR
ncbi:MAG: methyltransferase domain-containing protein [Actinomycetota bacterium]|nr:methyltransferase domain-containing protein [Actinomycetota bacterium]